MHVAVAIVGFRNPDDIARCLAALERSTHTDFEVSICENGGREACETLRRAIPARLSGGQAVQVTEAPCNLGYAGGVNCAMAQAPEADAWWVLNPDTEPQPEALAACLARLSKGDCDAVGCTIVMPGGRVQAYGGRWQAHLGRAVSMGYGRLISEPIDPHEVERRQSYLSGACMLISRRFLETVGPMREDYFLYCEEVEWFLRGGVRGMRLGFAAGAHVLHHVGTTTGSYKALRDLPKTPVFLNERNRILVTRDWRPVLLPMVMATAVAVFLLRFGQRGAWRQLGYAFSGWMAGLQGRRGPPPWVPTVTGPPSSTSAT